MANKLVRAAALGLLTCATIGLTAAGGSGARTSAAVDASGTVYTWGGGAGGSLVPVAVNLPGGTSAVAVSQGYDARYALGSDGSVYAWGSNGWGQLGNGTTTSSRVPVRAILPDGVAAVAISGGYHTALAAGSDGNVYSWGDNSAGQLGNGTTIRASFPQKVSLPGGVAATDVAEGYFTSLAVGSDGSVYAWGDGYGGWPSSLVPLKVSMPAGATATAVSAGVDTSIALGSDGDLYAWGQNNGKFGDGKSTGSSVPVKVSLPGDVAATAVSVGAKTTLSLGSDGSIYASGSNAAGEFGNGTTTSSLVPVRVSLPGGVAATAVSESTCQVGLCGGAFYVGTSMAVGSDGHVYGWGKNDLGQFGNGTQAGSLVPVKASLPAGVAAFAVSENNGETLAAAGVPGSGLHFTVADPPLAALAGTQYNAIFRAPGATGYELVGAPPWLEVTPTGAVTGTPPAGTGSFAYSLKAKAATSSATVGPFTVTVHAAATVAGTVERPDGKPLADALVQDCASVTGWQCRRTLTASDGTFSLLAPVAASIVLAAFPPPGSGFFASSRGPLTVPVEGIEGVRIVVGAAAAQELPSGLRINGQSTTPRLLWSRSSSATLTGCEWGLAVVSIIGVNRVNRRPFFDVIPLTETPTGSGTYVGTIPPQAPNNGPVRIDSSVTCPPRSPLLPNTGPATGGNTIHITGSGFTGASGVRFGGVAASFTVQADDLIEAVVPPGTSTVPVTVAVGTSIKPVDDYTYVSITSISPTSGPAGGGTAVKISGTGLASARRVAFGDTAADFVQVSDNEIQAVSPPGSGTRDITITTAYGGTTPLAPADRFTYLGTPRLQTTSHEMSSSALWATPRTSDGNVLPLASPITHSRTTIPQGAQGAALSPGVIDIDRLVFSRIAVLTTLIHKAKPILHAVIAGFNPTCDTTHAVLEDITGAAIEAVARLFIPGYVIPLTTTAVAALFASAPLAIATTAFVGTLIVWQVVDWLSKKAVDAYFGSCSGAAGFDSSPVVNGLIDPSGTVVDRNGNLISGATATILRSDSAAGPFAPVPAESPGISPNINPETTGSDGMFHWDVAAGFYVVEASKSGCTDPGDAGSPTSAIGPFPVPPPQLGLVITLACPNEPPPPVPFLTSLSVGTGPVAGGTTATILGSGFTPSSTVTFGITSAPVTFLSSEALTVVSPPGAGPVHVVVHNQGASSATSTADEFFYGSPPTVSALSVDHGPATGGTSVTVTGSGFTGATHVAFGGLPASSFGVVSGTEIRAIAPAKPAGLVHVEVVTPAGASATGTADEFTYESATQAIGFAVGSSRVDLQACKLEYSIVSPK